MVRKEYVVEEVQKLMHNRENIRNIAIVAHVDHGKSTLADSLLAKAGLISPELAGKQRFMDFEEFEQAHGVTIKASNISLGFNRGGKDYLINLIDTPGHVDFGGHVTRAMRAVDGVILVVDAVEGVMPQTETVLRQAIKERAQPVVFINKVDRLINELKLGPEDMQARLVKAITRVNKLITQYAPPEFKESWQVSVENGRVAIGSAFHKWGISLPIMQKTGLTFKDIYNHCAAGTHKELCARAPVEDVILEMAVTHLPNPLTAQKYRIPVIWHGDKETDAGKSMLACDPKGKVCFVATAVIMDEHAGEVATGRLFSGTLKRGQELWLASQYHTEKIQQIAVYMGPDRILVDEVPAGNIAALVGVKGVFSGETISDGEIAAFEEIKHYSEPVVTKCVEAKDPKDLTKLVEVLRKMAKEDPTIRVELMPETGEHLVSGMGEYHLELIEYKISQEHGIKVETSPPIVVYKEAIENDAGPVEGKSPNKHNKFKVTVEPLEPGAYDVLVAGEVGSGRPKGKDHIEKLIAAGMPRDDAKGVRDVYLNNVLIDATKGVQYMNEVMELLIQGFEEAMKAGPLAYEKVSGVKVKVVDAALHEDAIHRGPAQILPAIRRPIYAALLTAGVYLLEPKQKFFVQTPQEFMASVINEVQGRRGQMLDMTQEEESTTVIAKVPVAETFGFANSLRGATQGRAIWYYENMGYEKLPAQLQDKVVRQIRERKGKKPEVPAPTEFME